MDYNHYMDVVTNYGSNLLQLSKDNPKVSVAVAVSGFVGCYIALNIIPNRIFYSGFDQCPSITDKCNGAVITMPNGMTKEIVSWKFKGITLRGYLYRPRKDKTDIKLPCIILAHGLGHIAAQGLSKYAVDFCESGYIVLLFDYRTFGISDGLPRHQCSPSKHVEDYISAINYIKNKQTSIVDIQRISLFGTSLSGGHVLVVASKVKNIKCVISQTPYVAFKIPTENYPIYSKHILKLIYGEICLRIRSFLFPFQKELYLRITGDSTDDRKIAFFFSDQIGEIESQYKWWNDEFNKNEMKDYRNVISCRYVQEILGYKAYEYIDGLNENGTAVFYICTGKEVICSPNKVQYAHSMTTTSEIYNAEENVHFDVYQGELRDAMIKKQIQFFNKYT